VDLDDDDRSSIMDGDTELSRLLDRDGAHHRAIGVGGGDVSGGRTVVEGVLASTRAIDELIADHEVSRLHVRLQGSTRRRADDL